MTMRGVLLILSALSALAAFALDVTTTPGQLGTLLAGQSQSVETLAVKGTVDQSDLDYIASELTSLAELDLSGCTVAGGSIADGTFAGSRIATLTLPDQALRIGDAAFMGSALTAISIPSGSSLGMGAFAACQELKTVKLNGADLSAGYAFKDCKSLQLVDMSGVSALGEASFAGCAAMDKAANTDGISSIGRRAFAGCGALGDFAFGTSGTEIEAHAFAGSGLRSVCLASGSSLGEGAFFHCGSLGGMSLAEGLDSLPRYALKGAALAGELSLPEGLQSIGAYSLKDVTALEKITLPSTLAEVGDHAMDGMTGLAAIEAGELAAVPATGDGVWTGVDQSKVELAVAQNMFDSFSSANQWQDFNVIISEKGTVRLPSADESRVTATVSGDILTVEASDAEISRLELYDMGGRLLLAVDPSSARATVDLGPFQAGIIVVRATLDNMTTDRKTGASATFKIYRHG